MSQRTPSNPPSLVIGNRATPLRGTPPAAAWQDLEKTGTKNAQPIQEHEALGPACR